MVMKLVAGNVKRQAARRGDIAVHESAARPTLGAQIAKKGEGRSANRDVVGEKLLHRQDRELGTGDVLLLVEPKELAAVTARDTQGTVGKDPLIVSEMAEHLLDAPFSWAIGEIAARVAKLSEERDRDLLLAAENFAHIVSDHPIDICAGVLGVLARNGAARKHWIAMPWEIQFGSSCHLTNPE